MNHIVDLFEAETAALNRASETLARGDTSSDLHRTALIDLIGHYERLMRQTRRLIARSDRTELELNTVNETLQKLSAELEYKATHDNLTGALNRGAVFARANVVLQTRALSLIVLDIDFFKRINDAYGHPTGDEVIKELVSRLKHVLNGVGEVGRVGGEEFTVLLPAVPLDEAVRLAEDLRRAIADIPFICLPSRQVTASMGISCNEQNSDFEAAYARADAALYEAKRAGRNRVMQAA